MHLHIARHASKRLRYGGASAGHCSVTSDKLSAVSGIYQPIWKFNQRLTEPSFLSFPVTGDRHAVWRELWALCEMYRQGVHLRHAFTGLLSPRFGEKTGLRGSDVIAYLEAHCDSQVCFFSPVPQLPYIYFNLWDHGEHNHPGIVRRADQLLSASGVGLTIDLRRRHGPSVSCYSNYWVGTAAFWEAYVGGVLVPIATFLEQHPDHPAACAVMDEAEYEVPAAYLPFIIERLFTTFLDQHSEIPRVAWLRDPVAASLHEVQREIVIRLRDEVDAADTLEHFPLELRSRMSLLARLVTLYEIQYYARNPRPFEGRILPFKRMS